MSSTVPVPKDFNACLYTSLAEADPEVNKIIEDETWRQFSGLELIASENLTSLAVMEANGSILTNKYSEGLPGARYYGGNEHIDILENLCRDRALKAFNLDPKIWGVNVQPYAGSTANFAAFTALIQPQDRIMGLGLPDGGHLTHGYYTAKKKITASSIYFQSFPYQVDTKTGLIDYDRLETNANLFKPRLVICGASAYPRDWDYARLRAIADAQGAYLMMDMAHISGLVAAAEQNSPFEVCDVVTTTTHKTLRGPRAGLIFFRKDKEADIEARINASVFPACQGGPHNNTIAGIAVALKQAADPAFKAYAKQVRANAAAMAAVLFKHGYRLQTDGTENHLVLWDLRPLGLTGSKVEKICDAAHITLNKNAVAGDKSAQVPGGVRIGASALTSRSMVEKDVEQVAEFLHRVVQISLTTQKEAGSKLLKDFVTAYESGNGEAPKLIAELKKDVMKFATGFPLPGVPDTSVIKRPAGVDL
ncbi:serine hydroxymethyltransferase [Kockovaella imperatae]|uniref:Serine hydroxymethyltransferase n=1 Tax=Kockovaella imperatae TaxID=4999 RepID=A0A1Y1UN02_9TREE|nr:serine hydroxymethyltransferase [Kockovaella imperatae]ORX38826.1 serine hydroxymethyltransferase [Kockovaella imperatae]